jgi:L-ascorbate metabolism protein UlaG (beta-lactamase superfamily)
MTYTRRKFIKQGGLAALGMMMAPSLLQAAAVKKNGMIIPGHKPNPAGWDDNSVNLAWLGHSTILMNFYGTWILTDPVLFKRLGIPLKKNSIGPKRLTASALSFDEIPKPDIILLSHSHMDHMDLLSLKRLTAKYRCELHCVTSYKTKDVIEDMPFKSLQEIDWGQELSISGVNVKALEVKHFGWRFPWERDRSKGNQEGRSYNAYLIEKNGKRILFGGDTAMTGALKSAGIDRVDIAIMPVGAYYPWKDVHCNPEEALQMARDVNARYFVPIHCNTFKLGFEPFDEPLQWLRKSVSQYPCTLAIDEIGKSFLLA